MEILMASVKISQNEINKLLNMLKNSLIHLINFPGKGATKEFQVVGDTKHDIFTVSIYRGRINSNKYNLGGRITKNDIMLLSLHIGPSNVHINPNGEKITGNHWHVCDEAYGLKWAYPADDLESEQFVENTVAFLSKFHVIKQPQVNFQLELNSV